MAEEKKLPPTELQLKNLFTRNDFAEKHSDLSPAQQRNLYKQLWLEHTAEAREKGGKKSISKSDHSKLWKTFKSKHGELLSPELDTKGDIKPNAYSTEPVFKVRFTQAGNLSTTDSVISQKRADNIQFYTKATPGTELPFSKTSKRFYNPENWQSLEIHHKDSQASYEPFSRLTLEKIRSSDPEIRKQGQLEFESAAKEGYRTGAILGDKVEGFIAQPPDMHRNLPMSSHGLSGREHGINYTMQQSGGSAFDGGRSGSLPQLAPGIGTRQRLDQMPRTGDGDTVWRAAFGHNDPKSGNIGFYAATHDANVENANLATIFGKEDDRPVKERPLKTKDPGDKLRADIGDENYDLINKGNKKSIADTLLTTIKNKGRYRDILNTLGVSWNPAVNMTADVVGAVWDGVAVMADPSMQNKVDFAISSGIVGTNLAAIGLSLVPVLGARPGAWALMKVGDAASAARVIKKGTKLVEGGVENLQKAKRGLEVAEQTINRSREGIEISTNKKVQKAVNDGMRAILDAETKESNWTGRKQKVNQALEQNRARLNTARNFRATKVNTRFNRLRKPGFNK